MEANKKTLSGIFENKCFDIPVYQRGYDWKKVNRDSLMQDIEYCIDKKEKLFLGTVILRKNKDDDIGVIENYKIVDGQQRLTTLTLMFLVLKESMKLRQQDQDPQQQIKTSQRIAMLSNRYLCVLDQNMDAIRPVLHGATYKSKEIKDGLSYVCNLDWDGSFPTKKVDVNGKRRHLTQEFNRFRGVYAEFFNQFNRIEDEEYFYKLEDLVDIYDVLVTAELIEITVETEKEALYLFEVVNARGKDLEIADLLKNFFFSELKAWDKVEEHWSVIIENARDSGGISKLLKFFYHTRKGRKGSSNRELYQELKNINKNYMVLLKDIREFSVFFKNIKSGDLKAVLENLGFNLYGDSLARHSGNRKDIYTSIQLLRDSGVTQSNHLIFSFFSTFKKLSHNGVARTNDYALLKRYPKIFLRTLENFHYINYGVGDRRGNEIDEIYQEASKDIYNAKNVDEFKSCLKNLYAKLKPLRNKRAVFVDNFISKLGYNKSKQFNSLTLYSFHKIEREHNRNDFVLYDPINSTDVSRDHWADQSDTYDVAYEIIRTKMKDSNEGILDNIGNILPLNVDLNSSLGGLNPKTPEAKYRHLIDPNNHIVLEYSIQSKFFTDYSQYFPIWDEVHIKDRAKSLAEEIFNIIENEPPNI